MQALEGIRILEPGQLVAGPFASTLLGDFGAEVIKTELPEVGDPARRMAPMTPEGDPIWWKTVSRNKKSVTLDLRKPKGQALFRELVKHVDVVVENFRPEVMDQWGLGWDVLRAINPKLVMARQSGFGQDGPYAKRPAYGMMVEAYGGLTYANRYGDSPPVVTGLCDYIAGLFIAKAIMVALYHRDVHGGPGQLIDNSAAENALRIAGDPHLTSLGLGVQPMRRPPSQYPSWPDGALRMAGLFETGDGKFVNLHPGNSGHSNLGELLQGDRPRGLPRRGGLSAAFGRANGTRARDRTVRSRLVPGPSARRNRRFRRRECGDDRSSAGHGRYHGGPAIRLPRHADRRAGRGVGSAQDGAPHAGDV